MARIGIYPGTFDMLHDGHVAFAAAALEKYQLDRVVFLPEPFPRGKNMVSPVDVRRAYIEEKLADIPQLATEQLGVDRFSVRSTLPLIKARYGNDLVMLVGSDVAATLEHWPDLSDLTEQVHFAIGLRSGAKSNDLTLSLKSLKINYSFVVTNKAHLSSSMYR